MAISDDGKRGQVGPSLRGLIYQYERNGVWVTSKWPRPRGKVATPKQKLAQQAFKDVMLAMKMTAAPIQTFHRLAAVGTPMLPRDSLMAALYGNGPTIPFYDGKLIKPMANKLLSSTVLDAIGWQPGDILYRDGEYWERLPAPSGDGVLLYDPGLNKPFWGDASGLGSPGYWMQSPTGGFDASSRWSKGIGFRVRNTQRLKGVFFMHQEQTGRRMHVRVFKCTSEYVATDLLVDFLGGVGDGERRILEYAPLPAPIALEENQYYAIMIVGQTVPVSGLLRLIAANWTTPQLPIWPGAVGLQIITHNPQVGDDLGANGSTFMCVGMEVG